MSEDRPPYDPSEPPRREPVVTLPLHVMEAVMKGINRLHIGNFSAKDRPLIEEAKKEVEAVRKMVGVG